MRLKQGLDVFTLYRRRGTDSLLGFRGERLRIVVGLNLSVGFGGLQIGMRFRVGRLEV